MVSCCRGQVVALVVDNCRSSDGEVEGLTAEYTELEILSMVNVGLTSLSKLPPLPKLRKVSVTSGSHNATLYDKGSVQDWTQGCDFYFHFTSLHCDVDADVCVCVSAGGE